MTGATHALRDRLHNLFPATVHTGPAMGLRISRAEASADYRLGTNELPVQIAIAAALSPGDVFFDVGANVGFFALLAGRIVGTAGSVHAFEPVPANAARIRANARRNGLANVDVVEVAISDTAGATTLLLAAHPGGAAVASAGVPPDATGSIQVTTATIDGLVQEGRVPPPALVKIDVEGAEAQVLAGMVGTMRHHRPIVVCEIDGGTAAELAAKRTEILRLVHAGGYTTEDLPPSYPGSGWLVEHIVARPTDRA